MFRLLAIYLGVSIAVPFWGCPPASTVSVRSFTIGFNNTPFDEKHIAKIMAEKVASDHDILDVSLNDLYGDNYLKALWHSEKTFYNTLGVAKMLMSKHVANCGYRVVLTGEGADEIFGGYTAFKTDMLLHGAIVLI